MHARGYCLFDTEIGRCGIAWGEHGVVSLQLPEASDATTRARLRQRLPAATEVQAPPALRPAIAGIVGLLRGEPSDLHEIALDMRGLPAFHRRVYVAARTIVAGQTASYGELARAIGAPGGARAVGQALGRNPFAIIVPCHRVLAADGKPGGFSAHGGRATKLRLLAIERAACSSQLLLV